MMVLPVVTEVFPWDLRRLSYQAIHMGVGACAPSADVTASTRDARRASYCAKAS
jgi:hypothetical protein